MTDSSTARVYPNHTLRVDDETWKRFRIEALAANSKTGPFLAMLLDCWDEHTVPGPDA